MSLLLSTLLATFIMFGIPGIVAWVRISEWNQRRLARARKYRAVHGTPWWILETEAARRDRKYIEGYKDRMEALSG